MNAELEAFKRDLAESGQPWSRWGIRAAGAGLAALLVVQLSPSAGKVAIWLTDVLPNAFFILSGLAVATIAAGWVLLIIAFVKRRRWQRTHAFQPSPLTDAQIQAP